MNQSASTIDLKPRPPKPRRVEPTPRTPSKAPGPKPIWQPTRTLPGFLDTRPNNPTRPPDWRWRLARQLAGAEAPRLLTWIDGRVRQATYFATELMNCRCREDRLALAESWPELAAAHDLHFGGSPHRRWHLQARVLARQDDQAIARAIGGSIEVVQSYLSTFFDIRDRLDHPLSILINAIGPGIARGKAADLGEVWRHVAYHGGPHVLEALTFPYAGLTGAAPTCLADVTGDERTRLLAQVKLLEQTYLAPCSPAAVASLGQAHKRLDAWVRHFEAKDKAWREREEARRQSLLAGLASMERMTEEADQMAENWERMANRPFPPPPDRPARWGSNAGSPSTTAESTPKGAER